MDMSRASSHLDAHRHTPPPLQYIPLILYMYNPRRCLAAYSSFVDSQQQVCACASGLDTTTIIIVVVVVVMIAAGQGQGPSASDEHSAPSLSLCDRSCGQRRDEDCHRQADGRSDRIQVSSLWLHSRTTSEALDACLPRSTYVYIYIYIHT